MFNKALSTISKDDAANALFNAMDVRAALSAKTLNRPLDADTETTIGDCLDDVIQFLETLDGSFNN